MDKIAFDERVKRLHEVNKVIQGVDPAIRSAAFGLFEDIITGDVGARNGSPPAKGKVHPGKVDRETFFSGFNHDKPSDNAYLAAAYHYSQYGAEPIATKWLAQTAKDVGITIPDRVDATLNQAQHDGKSLFTRAGRGRYKPTVHGEKFLKKTYSVKKGTLPVPAEDGNGNA